MVQMMQMTIVPTVFENVNPTGRVLLQQFLRGINNLFEEGGFADTQFQIPE